MAITATLLTPKSYGFCVNATSSDASAAEEILAAPGAGYQLVITSLVVNCGASALTLSLGAGEAASAVETIMFGPFYLAAGGVVSYDLGQGICLPENKNFVIDASGGGAVAALVRGYTISV